MKKFGVFCLTTYLLMANVLGVPIWSQGIHAKESSASQSSIDMIAGDDERAASVAVGEGDGLALYAGDVADGTYEISAESSSSMFRIVKAELHVENGKMTADLTLGGKGYLKLFMGTGEEAVAADESEYASFACDADGAYVYTVPVEALNVELECTGFSKKKEKWYDHQICLLSEAIPEEAILWKQPEVDAKDGAYTMDVALSGGSGKASVTSPAEVTVTDGKMTARIEWSSPNYDYMIVRGKKYLPVNEEGNSIFEIPVLVLNEEMEVIADTTAMSVPHEIEYSLTFDTETLTAKSNDTWRLAVGIALVVAVLMMVFMMQRGRKRQDAK